MKITWLCRPFVLRALLVCMLFAVLAVPYDAVVQPDSASAAMFQETQLSRPRAFLHRPYYGDRTVLARTISFVDHDKPWYITDGLFVRFDGYRSNRSVFNCWPRVSCYDGHNGYDLDLRFEPVLSAAAGRVIRAGWYNPLNHSVGFGLWVAIDHGNGMVTAYGHLSSILVAVGDMVGVQWQIGTSGTTGASTGPHLHMSVYYLPMWQATDPFGWTAHYPDPNIVPDNFLWVYPPGTKTAVPYLSGDGKVVYPGGILVDDGDPGWSSSGLWRLARSATDINGDLRWTTTSAFGASATATWHPTLPANGYYEVGVFVDDSYATSGWLPYTVYSANPNNPTQVIRHTVYVDEAHIGSFRGPYGNVVTGAQWVGIGTYYFRSTQNGRIVVSNATGERGLQIAADGVEFVPA
jgi:murein DD-endopeptidase MepM/ murein hydrolase activator NlpD